jgi:hypothetical protein
MGRMLVAASVLAISGGLQAGCADQPASPSAILPAPAGSTGGLAKPGGGPASTTHDLSFEGSTFGDPGSDGYPSPGRIEASTTAAGLQGWITGPNASGYYKASATGAYTLLITDVSDIPDGDGDPCTEAQQTMLRDSGVLAVPVSGSFVLTVGEYTVGSANRPVVNWELTNVSGGPGYTWKLLGHSGSVNPLFYPQFDPASSTTSLVVTVENSVIDFQRFVTGARKPDLLVGKCRADFTMRMTKR